MKILILCNKMPFPANDGGAIATLNMIRGFENYNDNITVLSMQTHKHPFSVNELPNSLLSKITWYQVFVDTKLKPIKALFNLLFSHKPYNAVRFESKSYSEKLKKVLSQTKYDIIQLEGLYLYPYINIIRKFSSAKISFRAHNIEHEIWHRLATNEQFWLKRMYLKQLSKRVEQLEFNLLKKIDLLVPITQRDADILKKDNKKIFVSPTGIEESKFERKIPKYKQTLFYIGALDWMPNIEGLMWFINNVWNDISRELTDWEFVIAGRNASQKLEKELKKLNVKYIGEVESATEFIDEYSVMVVPLLSGSGMRIKIIEGMARGKCIFTTKIGVEGILAKNKESIFIQDSAEEFKQEIKNIIQNESIVDKCGKKAYIFAQENYNNNILIGNLREFYLKNILNS